MRDAQKPRGHSLAEQELKDLNPGRERTSKAESFKVLEVPGDGFEVALTLSVRSREDGRLGQQILPVPLAS